MLKIIIRILTGNALALALRIVSGILFPRYMTTQAYAEYQTFSLYLSYLTILCLGLPTGMFIKYGGQPFQSLDKGRYKSECTLLAGILLSFTALFFMIWLVRNDRMLLYITLCIIPYCTVCSYQSLWQAWGEFDRYNRSLVIISAGPLAGMLGFLLTAKKLEAEWFIYQFIGIYIVLAALIFWKTGKAVRGVRSVPVFDAVNLETWKTGTVICAGGYIYVLFHSLDKQIVKIVFDTSVFARYSFALSLQSLVTVFITALSQPMYHFLTKSPIPDNNYRPLMRILLMLGSAGGVAYHICRFGVAWFLPSYMDSLSIAVIYFSVFPPMTVIHCLFINLYKLRRLRIAYVIRLAAILTLSLVMNVILLSWRGEPVFIAVTNAAVYYFWFLADARTFRWIGFSLKDGLFLAGYMAIYVLTASIQKPIAAGILYMLMLCLLCIGVYRREMVGALKYTVKKNSSG